jgi:hypothetical protein
VNSLEICHWCHQLLMYVRQIKSRLYLKHAQCLGRRAHSRFKTQMMLNRWASRCPVYACSSLLLLFQQVQFSLLAQYPVYLHKSYGQPSLIQLLGPEMGGMFLNFDIVRKVASHEACRRY